MSASDEHTVEVRVLLHAVAAAILDLESRDPLAAKMFLSDLRFQVHHVFHLFPETHTAQREITGAFYSNFLETCVCCVTGWIAFLLKSFLNGSHSDGYGNSLWKVWIFQVQTRANHKDLLPHTHAILGIA